MTSQRAKSDENVSDYNLTSVARSQSDPNLLSFTRSTSSPTFSATRSFQHSMSNDSYKEIDGGVLSNGVLRWEEICYTLKEHGYLCTQDENIIRAINQLFEYYSVIIPVRGSSATDKLYIVPSLLNEPESKPTIETRTTNNSYFALEYKYGLPIHGSSRCHLEYRFSFPLQGN